MCVVVEIGNFPIGQIALAIIVVVEEEEVGVDFLLFSHLLQRCGKGLTEDSHYP